MAIELLCGECGTRLRVPPEAIGKHTRCPQCRNIQPVSPAARPSGTLAESWRLRTEDGQEYGPVSRSELERWIAEGRVTAGCWLLREGSSQWRWAGEVEPRLRAASPGWPRGERLPHAQSSRSKVVAGLLGLFLGPYGVHRFYLGYPGIGLLMLLTLGGCGVWSFIDSILVLCGSVPDGDGLPLRD